MGLRVKSSTGGMDTNQSVKKVMKARILFVEDKFDITTDQTI